MFISAFLLSFLLGASARLVIPPSSITLPLYLLPRDVPDQGNVSTVAGITPVSASTDRQYVGAAGVSNGTVLTVYRTYYVLLQTGDVYFRVVLDSGSSDLWLLGSSCTTASCAAVPRYPLSYGSPTFGVVNNNQTLFKASYSDGTGSYYIFILNET
jgi:hypothetical protein